MILLPHPLRLALSANDLTRRVIEGQGGDFDPPPILKLFNPVGAATWLATELGEDGDVLFGLADLGFGCPELGYFSLSEIGSVRLPFGLGIERDEGFATPEPLSRWTALARQTGSTLAAAQMFFAQDAARRFALPPDPDRVGG